MFADDSEHQLRKIFGMTHPTRRFDPIDFLEGYVISHYK